MEQELHSLNIVWILSRRWKRGGRIGSFPHCSFLIAISISIALFLFVLSIRVEQRQRYYYYLVPSIRLP